MTANNTIKVALKRHGSKSVNCGEKKMKYGFFNFKTLMCPFDMSIIIWITLIYEHRNGTEHAVI